MPVVCFEVAEGSRLSMHAPASLLDLGIDKHILVIEPVKEFHCIFKMLWKFRGFKCLWWKIEIRIHPEFSSSSWKNSHVDTHVRLYVDKKVGQNN